MMDIAAAKKRCEAVRKSHREIETSGQPDCTGCNQIWPCHARTLADILAAALEALEEAQGKLKVLVKATQPMDFCHVCLSVHSNFKDASDHKEWCAWDKADSFLRGSKEDAAIID